MTAYLTITQPPPYSTVQDLGRPGHQALGVTDGGVLDRDAMVLGNALVGNETGAAGVEICLGGFAATLHNTSTNSSETRRIAMTGCQTGGLFVTDQAGQRRTMPANQSILLATASQIHIRSLTDSNCVFLAIEGGIGTPLVYHSRATSPNAQIGGIAGGRLLQQNDRLPLLPIPASHDTSPTNRRLSDPSIFAKKTIFRVVFGPQHDRFTDEALRSFLTTPYQVTPAMDRMGMRLDGVRLTHKQHGDADIASDGIVAGAIQVAGDGMPIILRADHQTTGGYTKIATVISSDVPALARLHPNDTIRFAAISIAEAEAAAKQHASRVHTLADML